MNNPDTELLFPLRVIPYLKSIRGKQWDQLVDEIIHPEVELLDQLAFVYMIVKQAGCVTCNMDAFRAMRGCTQCAIQTIRRFRGSDDDLVKLFNESRKKVQEYQLRQSR